MSMSFTAENILRLAREDDQNLQIISICMAEIKKQAMKQTGGNQLVKRYNAAMKYIKAIDDERPRLKGAYPIRYQGKDCQALVNGFTGIILYNPISELPLPVENDPDNYLKLDEIIKTIPDDYQVIDVDLSDIIAATKGIGKYEKPTYAIGNQHFDPRLIAAICPILGSDLVFHVSDKANVMMYITNDNGIAVVLPLRK